MSLRQTGLVSFLLISAAILFFWNLGQVPLFDPDEGRYSEMALHMVESGDYMIPRMNGIVHLHKPPLTNWMVAASIKLFGANEFSTRLPSVILSLMLLFMMVRLGTFLFDFKTGYYSAWILMTSALYLVVSRLVTTDMAVTFFTFLAMACFAGMFFGSSKKTLYFYGLMLCLGLGMMTKGPVTWMIPLAPACVFMILKKKKLKIAPVHWFLGILLFLAVSLSWYLTVIFTHEGAWDYFVHQQILGRMVKGQMGRPQPFFYYLLIAPLAFIPWSVSMPFGMKWLFKNAGISQEERDKLFFIVCWFLVPFILFSSFRTKLATYIIPLFPPLALLAGFFWRRFETEGLLEAVKFPKKTFQVLGWIFALLAAGGLVFSVFFPQFSAGIPLWDRILLVFFLSAGSARMFFLISRKDLKGLFYSQVGIMIGMGLIVLTALPFIQFKNAKVFAAKIQELRKPGEKVVMAGTYSASLPFYLRERLIEIGMDTETAFENEKTLQDYVYPHWADIRKFLESSDRVWILASQDYEERLEEMMQGKFVHIIFRQGKLILFSNQK